MCAGTLAMLDEADVEHFAINSIGLIESAVESLSGHREQLHRFIEANRNSDVNVAVITRTIRMLCLYADVLHAVAEAGPRSRAIRDTGAATEGGVE